jgi:hypothetical protein
LASSADSANGGAQRRTPLQHTTTTGSLRLNRLGCAFAGMPETHGRQLKISLEIHYRRGAYAWILKAGILHSDVVEQKAVSSPGLFHGILA